MSDRFAIITQQFENFEIREEWKITNATNDITKRIDHDANIVIDAFILENNFEPNPLWFERWISESVTLLDRCLAGRQHAKIIQDKVFETVVRYAQFDKLIFDLHKLSDTPNK